MKISRSKWDSFIKCPLCFYLLEKHKIKPPSTPGFPINSRVDALLKEEFDELKEALNDKSNIVHEAADTIYHILVTLEAADIKFEDVLKELEDRKKQSGIEEKNTRL